MKPLAILGANGHGKVVADAALASGWSSVVFYDDLPGRGPFVEGWPVLGTGDELLRTGHTVGGVIVAIGNNRIRLEKLVRLESAGLQVVTVQHPSAVVSRTAVIGAGTVLCALAVVNPAAVLGRGCIINTSASVDHDCRLGDGVHVSPGAHLGGEVQVGEAAWIGIGASVRHQVHIGRHAIVGAGAAVVNHVDAETTVVGVPARVHSC